MVDPLEIKAATDGVGLPVTQGSVTLAARNLGPLATVAPFRGCHDAASTALAATTGQGLPEQGRAVSVPGVSVIWFAWGQWLVAGHDPAALTNALQGSAAVTDQSDGWAVLSLAGRDAADVLARLCPLDAETIPVGTAARTELAHMMALVVRSDGGWTILVMRSFARSAVHHIAEAMCSVAAQEGMRTATVPASSGPRW